MQYSTYVDARLGATVAVNLALRFRAFLITYLGALVNNRSAPAPLGRCRHQSACHVGTSHAIVGRQSL